MFDEQDLTTELSTYKCGSCGSTKWKIQIGRRSDGEIFLIIICGNETCVEKKRAMLGVEEDALIAWDEYNITDQYDKTEEDEVPTEVN